MREKDTPSVHVRVRLFGDYCVEYRNEDGTWQTVLPHEWGGTTHARRLLGFLLLHGRRAGRGKLMEQLWPESDSLSLEGSLNKAVSTVRKVFRADGLLTINSKRTTYQLADQSYVWADVDAYGAALQEAEQYTPASLERSRLLATAQGYFERGPLLDGEDDLWCHAKRESVETAYYRCLLWLAEAYEVQGRMRQAEEQLEKLLQRNPLDEVVLSRLMKLLQQQGLGAEAYRRYKSTAMLFKKHGVSLSSELETFARDLLQSSHALQESRQDASSLPMLTSDTIPANQMRPTVSPRAEGSTAPIPDTGLRPLYVPTEQQLTTLASLLSLGETIMFDPTKRQTLEALLAALSVALVKPQGMLQIEAWKPLLTPTTEIPKANPEIMQGLHSLIDACWQFSRGTELALAEKLLPECMARLVPLAQQASPYQQEATSLAAQGYQLYSILALHQNDLFAKELYCKQAVHYSLLSGDRNILVVSLRQLADTYRYNNQYPQMLQTYLNALQYTEDISPLFQSCMHSGLAIAYAHVDQKQMALTHLGLAVDTFPEHPSVDLGYSFADFDHAWLILREGIIRTRLGQTKQALEAFKRIDQSGMAIPERIRVEIVNQQGKTAIVTGDLEQAAAYVKAGITGAKALGSQRRYSEAYENFQQMRLLWPQERRMTELGELFH